MANDKSTGEGSTPAVTTTNMPTRLQDNERLYPDLPLDRSKRQIRVLHLHHGRWESPIIGRLEVVDLEADPKFEALSYTWGAKGPDTITVNDGIQVPITLNLFSALRRFRHRRKPRVLWIDAICINQNDMIERAHQVSFMGDVYKSARVVGVWLGDVKHPVVNSAFHDFLASRTFLIATRLLGLQNDDLSLIQDMACFAPALLAKPGLYILNDILEANKPLWHTRAWVFQEYHCARRVDWYFGGYRMRVAPTWGLVNKVGYPTPESIQMGLKISRLQHGRSGGHGHSPGTAAIFSLFQCMVMTDGMDATDLHDKVYSILGLTKPGTANSLVPDYNKPISELFADATYIAIEQECSFEFLALANCNPSATLDMPSWAVDFSNHRSLRLEAYNLKPEKSFVPRVKRPDSRTFQVQGHVLGIVQHVRLLKTRSDAAAEITWHRSTYPQCYPQHLDRDHLTAGISGAVKSFVLNPEPDSYVAFDFEGPLLLEHFNTWWNLMPHNRPYHLPQFSNVLFAAWEGHTLAASPPNAASSKQCLFEQVWNKGISMFDLDPETHEVSFLVTTSGELCLVMGAIKPGAVLLKVHGSLFPFVVTQREDGCFAFCGLAYYNGMARHGLRDSTEDQGYAWQDILLR